MREPRAPSTVRSPPSPARSAPGRRSRRQDLAGLLDGADALGEVPHDVRQRLLAANRCSAGRSPGGASQRPDISCTVPMPAAAAARRALRRARSAASGVRAAQRASRPRGGRSAHPAVLVPAGQVPQPGGLRERGADEGAVPVDAGQDDGVPGAARSSSARWARGGAPARLVPAEPRQQFTRHGAGGDGGQQLLRPGDPVQVQAGVCRAGLGQVDVRVDERRGDEPALELDDLVAVAGPRRGGLVRAHPRDRRALDEHGRRERVGREYTAPPR